MARRWLDHNFDADSRDDVTFPYVNFTFSLWPSAYPFLGESPHPKPLSRKRIANRAWLLF